MARIFDIVYLDMHICTYLGVSKFDFGFKKTKFRLRKIAGKYETSEEWKE